MESLRGMVGELAESVATGHIRAGTAVGNTTLQSTLADRTKSVAIGCFDAVHAAAHAVDVFGAYLHMIECAPFLCHACAEGVVVVYGGVACLTVAQSKPQKAISGFIESQKIKTQTSKTYKTWRAQHAHAVSKKNI